MIVNLIVIGLILLIGFHYSRKNSPDSKRNRKKYIGIICFILILQSGLRNVAVGADTYGYSFAFNEALNLSWAEAGNDVIQYLTKGIGKDPGYNFFQKTVQIFTSDYQVYLVVVAVIFFISFGFFLYDNLTRSKDLILAFIIYSVLFYSFFSITGIRQTIATGMVLFSYYHLKQKNTLIFILLIFFAFLIHKTAILFLAIYLLTYIKNFRLFTRVTILIFPIFFIMKEELSLLAISFSGYEEYGFYEGSGTYVFTSIFLIIIIAGLIRAKHIMAIDHRSQLHFKILSFALILLPLSFINPTFLRIAIYFTIFLTIFLPNLIFSFTNTSQKIQNLVRTLAIVSLIVLFIKANLNAPPYGFFWEKMNLLRQYQ